ncbi:MAG: hypothetical protein ACI9D5_000507 [Candidatus Endobugula sp.]|jgi:hypothetical protein
MSIDHVVIMVLVSRVAHEKYLYYGHIAYPVQLVFIRCLVQQSSLPSGCFNIT